MTLIAPVYGREQVAELIRIQAIRLIATPGKLRHVGPVSHTWHRRWNELDGGVTPVAGAAS